jgi:hypothetical protein
MAAIERSSSGTDGTAGVEGIRTTLVYGVCFSTQMPAVSEAPPEMETVFRQTSPGTHPSVGFSGVSQGCPAAAGGGAASTGGGGGGVGVGVGVGAGAGAVVAGVGAVVVVADAGAVCACSPAQVVVERTRPASAVRPKNAKKVSRMREKSLS